MTPQPAHQGALRALHTPRPVRVEANGSGDPVRIRLPGRPPRLVEQIRERWRIDDEWWRRVVARVYFDLVLENGRSLILYHDETDGRWLVHE